MTTSEEIALVDTLLGDLIGAGGIEEFTEAGDSAKFVKLEKLWARKDQLQRKLAAESGGQFRLAELSDR